MPSVTCPSCGEKGAIPKHLVGARIKCKKCGTAFVVTAPAVKSTASTPVAAAASEAPASAGHKPDTIEVEGLDESSWSATAVDSAEHEHEHDEATSSFTASPHEGQAAATGLKHYKVLTQKDKFFEGKFELPRLEDALNHYARQGWVVRSVATPLVAGFSGGPREEIVVVLER